MTDPPTTSSAASAPPARGRGLVIAGAIIVGLFLVPAVAMIVWLVVGIASSPQAISMVFPFWLIGFIGLSPLWIAGILLLGIGRATQRGSVRGAPAAWILAVGGIPAIGVLLGATVSLLSAGQDTIAGVSFVALVVGIPVLTVLALLTGAWLTWGRPRSA